MFTLNRVVTSNDYTQAATLRCPGAGRINLYVENAGIYFQWAYNPDTNPDALPPFPITEIYRAPGQFGLDRRADAVRVRSAVPGVPATVTIDASLPGEISGDTIPGGAGVGSGGGAGAGSGSGGGGSFGGS